MKGNENIATYSITLSRVEIARLQVQVVYRLLVWSPTLSPCIPTVSRSFCQAAFHSAAVGSSVGRPKVLSDCKKWTAAATANTRADVAANQADEGKKAREGMSRILTSGQGCLAAGFKCNFNRLTSYLAHCITRPLGKSRKSRQTVI